MTEFFLQLALEVALSVVTGICVLGVAPVLRRLFKKTSIEDITPEWVESFSVERYRPMAGLLSDEDFAFLSRQPGFDASIYRKLRRERLVIFEQYLNRLILDFKKLHVTARYLVAQSEEDHSDLAMSLIRLRLSFAMNVVAVQMRFQFFKLGVGRVNTQILIGKLQQMSEQLNLAAVPQAV
jgi:hypothetical protein